MPKDTPCDTKEHRDFRRLVGSIIWVSRETRFDVLGTAVGLSTKLSKPTLQDVVTANRACQAL
eukprot:14723842-Alexandrium_andersonii.AAC.1